MDAVSANTLVRILCLHGYGQNGNIFKEKLGGFRKFFKNRAEFSFVDAPHSVITDGENDEKRERCWSVRRNDGCWDREKFDESFKYFAEFYAKNQPFDGLLGFSQGAEFAAMLCSIPTYKFKFVILIAGSKSRVPEYSVYYENEIKVPSLHVIGEGDQIIVRSRSEELRNCFCQNTSETLLHEGGHYVPVKNNCKEKYKTFVEKYSTTSKSYG